MPYPARSVTCLCPPLTPRPSPGTCFFPPTLCPSGAVFDCPGTPQRSDAASRANGPVFPPPQSRPFSWGCTPQRPEQNPALPVVPSAFPRVAGDGMTLPYHASSCSRRCVVSMLTRATALRSSAVCVTGRAAAILIAEAGCCGRETPVCLGGRGRLPFDWVHVFRDAGECALRKELPGCEARLTAGGCAVRTSCLSFLGAGGRLV